MALRRGRDGVDRDQHLCDGRDHALQLLAMTRSSQGENPLPPPEPSQGENPLQPPDPSQGENPSDRRGRTPCNPPRGGLAGRSARAPRHRGLIALGVALRLLTLRSPGFPSDVGTFQAWAEQMVRVGPGAFYAPDVFRRLPAGLSLRPLVPRRALRRRAAASRGESREHPGRHRDRDRGGDARVAPRWSVERDARCGSLVAPSRRDLRRSVLGTDRRRRLASAVRRAGRSGPRPLRDCRNLAAVAAMVKPQFGIGAVLLTAGALIELSATDAGSRWSASASPAF